jgi:hypothetical protein
MFFFLLRALARFEALEKDMAEVWKEEQDENTTTRDPTEWE